MINSYSSGDRRRKKKLTPSLTIELIMIQINTYCSKSKLTVFLNLFTHDGSQRV